MENFPEPVGPDLGYDALVRGALGKTFLEAGKPCSPPVRRASLIRRQILPTVSGDGQLLTSSPQSPTLTGETTCRTLLVDNYDSFTYSLYQLLTDIGGIEPFVVYNDTPWEDVEQLLPFVQNIVISPGPGRPDRDQDFGVCKKLLLEFEGPILGICLGLQGMATTFGGSVIHAPEPRHGRLSSISHDECPLFDNIPQKFKAIRYNSLICDLDVPECLRIICTTEDTITSPEGNVDSSGTIIMGLKHRERPIYGVQFHPESICTEYGRQLVGNFFHICAEFTQASLLSPTKKVPVPSRDVENTQGKYLLNNNKSTSSTRSPNSSGYRVLSQTHDFKDPEQVFMALFASKSTSFWLDSSKVEPGLSRFSFMGAGDGPHSVSLQFCLKTRELTVTDTAESHTRILEENFFDYLNEELNARFCDADLPFDFNCGFVGCIGYEMKSECGIESPNLHVSKTPDARLFLADRVLVFDHEDQLCYTICLTTNDQHEIDAAKGWLSRTANLLSHLPATPPLQFGPSSSASNSRGNANDKSGTLPATEDSLKLSLRLGEEDYLNAIQECTSKITDAYFNWSNPEPMHQTTSRRQLDDRKFRPLSIVCCSPERFLCVDREGWVECKPIKGTAPRGETKEEDLKLKNDLATGEKEFSENLMIVDLMRSDLGKICKTGSISVPKLMSVESYATVHQLVSTVRGQLHDNVTAVQCVKSAFPAGSMTGAPKIRSMQLLEQLEKGPRGIYSGCIGYFGLNGTADMNVVIRTVVVTEDSTQKQTELSIGAGGAIVALSDVRDEFQEMLLKAKALISGIASYISGETLIHYDEIEFEKLATHPNAPTYRQTPVQTSSSGTGLALHAKSKM